MKSQTEEQKTTETKKPRFKIEKLEERIAPRHGRGKYMHGCHENPHGKVVGCAQ
jgi:hypothetical protein